MKKLEDLRIRNGRGISESEIDATELSSGFDFPVAFRALVRRYNGGTPEVGAFDFSNQSTAISEFFKCTLDENDPHGIPLAAKRMRRLSPKLVPFARDAGDWLICLDYCKGDDPSVSIFSPELNKIWPVASSFESFINLLYE